MASLGTIGISDPVKRDSVGPAPAGWVSLTKITRPKAASVSLRERLFRSLDSHRRSPSIWVAAPAGSGKTTLVASYLAARKLKSIWYRIDERDGDIASFSFYMALAAEKGAPAIRCSLPLFTPEYRQGLEMDVLAEELYRRLMKCHQAAGQEAAAIATYQRCRRMLRTVLGVDPSRETEAVYRALCKR